MKSYAVVAYFNQEFEKEIFRLWKALNDLGISSYGTENLGRRPHITFADYDELPLEEYMKDFELFFSNREPISVTMSIIGSFIGSKTIFLMDPIDISLRKIHLDYHHDFTIYPTMADSKYVPENWIPHCTIASRLDGIKMLEAYDFCNKNIKNLTGNLSEFTLLELTHDESGKVIKDCAVKSLKLKRE